MTRVNYPLVSIIIPTYNSKNFFRSCLDSLLKLDYPNVEIIVVDDGSTDGSFEEMRKKYESRGKFVFIQNVRRLGIAGSRNVGISVAGGKYLAFVEMDMEVDKLWLKKLVRVLEKDRTLAGVTPKVLDFHKRDVIQAVGIRIIPHTGWVVCLGFGQLDRGFNKTSYTSLGGVGSVVRASVVRKVRGYDVPLDRNVEDVDFGWRVWVMGGRIKYIPDAIVYHWTAKPWSARKDGLTMFDQEFHLNKAPRLIIKNFETRNVLKYLPQALLIYSIRIVLNLIRGNYIPLLSGIKAFFWQIVQLPSTLSERHYLQKNRKYSDSYLMGKLYERGSFVSIYNRFIKKSLERSASWHT